VIILNITEEIKNSLKNKGLKQSYIAEQLNISNQSFWYKLQNNTFKIDELFKLAKILGINLNKFKEV
jgi:transcriptional regulator with XRE-family HTH domain